MHINRLVVAIRNGWIKLDAKKKEPEEEKFWDIWENTADDQELARKMPPVLSAPKLKLPGHAESYNPSEEYLFSKVRILNRISSNNFSGRAQRMERSRSY